MRSIVAAGLALVACGVNAGASPCDTATTAAAEALEHANEVSLRPVERASVHPDDIPPAPSVTPTDEFYISPESQARIEAGAENRRLQNAKEAEVLRHMTRWTIIIEQNPECFTVDERANAEQVARQLGGG